MNEQLIRQIVGEEIQKILGNSFSVPLDVDRALRARGFLNSLTLTGIVRATSGTLSAITPLSGSKQYFVSDSNGGATDRRLTFNNGVLTSES